VTLIGGQLLAVLVVVILEQLYTEQELKAWAWRIPFVVGAITAVVALLLRRTLHETSSAATRNNKNAGSIVELFTHHKAAFFTVLGYTAGGSLIFYTFTTYMQKFMINTTGLPKEQVTWINFVALLLFVCLQPAFGALSDRIGRRPLLIAFGVGATLCTVPLLTAVSHAQSALAAFGLMMLGLLIVSGYTSINAVVKAELFPARIRALGVGLPYALTVAIFGGSTEYVALWLKNIGHENWFFFYVAGCGLISLMVYVFMGETSRRSQLERETRELASGNTEQAKVADVLADSA
jgi:MHS family alpha-ketoglutarate permease-like MFS transporter